MEYLIRGFLALAIIECIVFNWCIMSIWFELRDIRKEIEKTTEEQKR